MSGRSARAAPRRRITAGEVADVAVAQVALLAALLRTRRRPTGQLVLPDAGGAGAEGDDPPRPALDATPPPRPVERAVRAVDRASRRGLFRPTCLVRSLALVRMLERQGVTGARVRLGVRRAGPGPGHGATSGERARVHAHAWVEVDGAAVGEDPRHLARFTPLGAVRSAPRA